MLHNERLQHGQEPQLSSIWQRLFSLSFWRFVIQELQRDAALEKEALALLEKLSTKQITATQAVEQVGLEPDKLYTKSELEKAENLIFELKYSLTRYKVKKKADLPDIESLIDPVEKLLDKMEYHPPRKKPERSSAVENQNAPTFDERYADFLARESREPSDLDMYHLPIEGSQEKALLLQLASAQEVATQEFSRKTLQKAGYAFVNRYSGWEKPLLQGVVGELNLSNRVLLTASELQAVIEWQKEQLIALPDPEMIDQVRKDLFLFILASEAVQSPPFTSSSNTFTTAVRDIRKRYNQAGSSLITKWVESVGISLSSADDDHDQVQQLMKSQFSQAYPFIDEQFMVGIPIRSNYVGITRSRTNALRGLNSPFLDSGYQFIGLPDLTLNLVRLKTQTKPVMRINQMVLHLASKNLSELGAGTGSWDQHYATLAEYHQHVFTKDETILNREKEAVMIRPKLTNDALLDRTEARIVELSLSWAKNSTDPAILSLLENMQLKVDDQLPY